MYDLKSYRFFRDVCLVADRQAKKLAMAERWATDNNISAVWVNDGTTIGEAFECRIQTNDRQVLASKSGLAEPSLNHQRHIVAELFLSICNPKQSKPKRADPQTSCGLSA